MRGRGKVSARFLAFLALDELVAVSAEQLADAMKAQFPAIPMSIQPVERHAGALGQSFMLSVDETVLTVMFIDERLPRDAYETALQLDRLWPQATQAMQGHRTHIIAATLAEPKNHGEAIDAAAALTLTVAVLADLARAKAVIWSNAETIIEPDRFISAAAGLQDKQIPVDVWTGLRWLDGPPTENGARTLAVLTSGLLPFIGREIEFEPAPMSPYEIGQRVIGLSGYLIRSGPVIGDGETVGLTEDEHIRARHTERGQRPGVPALQLTVESKIPDKPSRVH